jgi:UDP-N-acetylmuramoylalanine--D-glutamate ligase
VIPPRWRSGEVAVLGLGRSGRAASLWLAQHGVSVYASDSDTADALQATARELRTRGIGVDVGAHDLERIRRAVAVVVSPGIPPSAPPLATAREANVEVVAELELAVRALGRARSVVVTGTNGKTTTTALVAHILRKSGLHAEAGGNIGRPLIDLARDEGEPDWVVVEASSFQLHDAPSIHPTIGVLTNLSPDHLNRYPNVDAYYADKQLLFRNADAGSIWVLNGDDDGVRALCEGVPGRRRWWSLRQPANAWFDSSSNALVLDDTRILERGRLALLGDHNVHNALAASLAADAAGVSREAIADGLASFAALPHRLEPVREFEDRTWINDSKATNVASAAAALQAMQGSYVLIAGGRGKDESFEPLGPLAAKRCRHAVVYGEAGSELRDVLEKHVPVTLVDSLAEAVRAARSASEAGDAILLSPACASFDQFTNYEERGDVFRQLVSAL